MNGFYPICTRKEVASTDTLQTNSTTQTAEMLKLEGVVEHVIYENPDTGYAVFEVDAGGTDIVVAGNVGSVDNGMSITAYGYMVNHPSYGEQFRAETCEASLPQDTAALLSYLSSGVLPYIGPSTAKKIVAKFGAHTLNVISETPDKLCELKGITPQKAAAISNEFRRMYGVREVVAWMAKFGLSAQMAVTAYRAFGPDTVEALKKNPYMLCGEPLNLKFSQVDGIAAQLQVGQGSDLRIAAGLLYALRHNANNGRPCLPADKLKNTVASGVSGIGMGLIGVGIPDIPVFTGMLLKSLYETALSYGYDYDRMDEKYFILLLIGAALRSGDELKAADERVNYFIEHGAEPDEETMKTEVKIAAEGLSGELLYMKFLQGIPIVGAVGGAYDPIYIDRITRYAAMKYNRRFLHDIKNKH